MSIVWQQQKIIYLWKYDRFSDFDYSFQFAIWVDLFKTLKKVPKPISHDDNI